MARLARGIYTGRFFHAMVQGQGKEHIFPNDLCKGYYLKCLKKNKQLSNVKILAFCVMGNHAHILLVVDSSLDMTAYFRHVNTQYAAFYNRHCERIGYVFRDRYKSEPIGDVNYLVNCLAYIQNNPLKAGLVANAEDYQFSSYNDYVYRSGVVDFEEAAKYYAADIENIKAIMAETTDTTWLEHDDRDYVKVQSVLNEFTLKYEVTNEELLANEELLSMVVKEIIERCKISSREIATVLDVNRNKIRKIMMTLPQ